MSVGRRLQVGTGWALGDYKFADWFGIRRKVKTTMGLYNAIRQDLEFLHAWAILPQSAYPLDLRASTIAHEGGDFYGKSDCAAPAASLSRPLPAAVPTIQRRLCLRAGRHRFEHGADQRHQTGGTSAGTHLHFGPAGRCFYLNSAAARLTRPVAPGYVLPINIDIADKTLVYYWRIQAQPSHRGRRIPA